MYGRVPPCDRAAHGPALAALAIGVALLATSGMWHSQHVLTDRDPGVYNNTVDQFPGLGNLPVLGTLFRSTNFQRQQTELIIAPSIKTEGKVFQRAQKLGTPR